MLDSVNLPFISAICLVFGRRRLLNEALGCFLSQDYAGEHELVLLNSFTKQTIEFDHPKVRVVNLPQRPPSLADCRNAAIEHSRGSVIAIWDSDDAFGPNHLSVIGSHFLDWDWIWLDKQFYTLGGRVKDVVQGTMNVVCFTKTAWDRIGKYKSGLSVGEDRDFVGRLTSQTRGQRVVLQDHEITGFYGWGNQTDHISGLGDDVPRRMPAYQRTEMNMERLVRRGVEKTGRIVLQPTHRINYAAAGAQFLMKISSRSVPQPSHNAFSRAPEGVPTIFHACEHHTTRKSIELARKAAAWASWDVLYQQHHVLPRHYSAYERSSKALGDDLDLPYFKDVLKWGMAEAENDDIILWTNDDTILHPSIATVLRGHLEKHPVVSISRCEFRRRCPPASVSPEVWARADVLKAHNGRDLMAFRKSWLVEHWDDIPDFILGASEFDVFMTVMIRHFYGINDPRANLHAAIHPAEIPRGLVGHIRHFSKWNDRRRIARAPAQLHNIRLYGENVAKYTNPIWADSTAIWNPVDSACVYPLGPAGSWAEHARRFSELRQERDVVIVCNGTSTLETEPATKATLQLFSPSDKPAKLDRFALLREVDMNAIKVQGPNLTLGRVGKRQLSGERVPLFILGHPYTGDHIICAGMYRVLAKDWQVNILTRPGHQRTVGLLMQGIPDSVAIEIPEADMDAYAASLKDSVVLRFGDHLDPNFDHRSFDKGFYRHAKVDFRHRWDSFRVPDIAQVPKPDGDYVFVHDRPDLNNAALNISGEHPRPSANIFAHRELILGARALHCVSSAFAAFADCFDLSGKELNFYSFGREVPTHKNKWHYKHRP